MKFIIEDNTYYNKSRDLATASERDEFLREFERFGFDDYEVVSCSIEFDFLINGLEDFLKDIENLCVGSWGIYGLINAFVFFKDDINDQHNWSRLELLKRAYFECRNNGVIDADITPERKMWKVSNRFFNLLENQRGWMDDKRASFKII